MAAAHLNRSNLRDAQVNFRLSKADRDELKARAHEAGLSVQSYLELVALGSVRDVLPAGRPPRRQEELPMTG